MASRKRKFVLEFIVLFAALVYIYPILMAVSNAFKSNNDYLFNPYGLPKEWMFDNIIKAAQTILFFEAGFNTLLTTVCVVTLLVFFSAMTAYAIVKRSDGITRIMYFVMMSGLLIPFQVYMITLVKLHQVLGISRTPLALILSIFASSTPLSVFLYSGYLKSIPNELEEAAKIDGCGPYRTFFSVIMPVIKPCVAMVIIFFSLSTWNSFIQPLVIIGNTHFKMLFIQISNMMSNPYTQQWNLNFAACLLAMTPVLILYIIMQNRIINGLTSGSVKG